MTPPTSPATGLVRLLPLDEPGRIELAAQWLAHEANYRWLDFGGGVQVLTPVMLRIMTQRDHHVVRLYTAPDEDLPIGIVGLANVDRRFRTAMLWAVLGNKRYGGTTHAACAQLLDLGFADLGLQAVNAWTVDVNVAARRALERLRFTYVGRQRRCHAIDGRPHDRLLFDLLAAEHGGG